MHTLSRDWIYFTCNEISSSVDIVKVYMLLRYSTYGRPRTQCGCSLSSTMLTTNDVDSSCHFGAVGVSCLVPFLKDVHRVGTVLNMQNLWSLSNTVLMHVVEYTTALAAPPAVIMFGMSFLSTSYVAKLMDSAEISVTELAVLTSKLDRCHRLLCSPNKPNLLARAATLVRVSTHNV